MTRHGRNRGTPLLLAAALLMTAAPAALAHPDAGGDLRHQEPDHLHDLDDGSHDLSAPLAEHDDSVTGIVSAGPNAKVTKNLDLVGHGERLVPNATTDVWALGDYAYLGTFNVPCGTGEGYGGSGLVHDLEGPGIPVFDVSNKSKPTYVGSIPSVEGSRINDVKVMSMSQGDVLVHSNERCGGGPGGFEVYNVDDPLNPVHLARVQTDDLNLFLHQLGYADRTVHNNYLFTRDGRDYNAVQVTGIFGTFQVYDITDPTDPELVSWFGAEYVLDPTTDWVNLASDCDPAALAACEDWPRILDGNTHVFTGFGASANRVLHDMYVTPDGEQAYLAMWDEGLLLVDLGDLDGSPATLISQAIDVERGSLDGEVNSHSVWPTADGTIVIEGEEDFNAWEINTPLGSVTVGEHDSNTIPAVGVSTGAGNDFEDSPTGNAAVLTADALTITGGELEGNVYPANEMVGNQPKLGDGSVTAEAVWVGRACDTDALSVDPVIDPPGIVDALENDPTGKIAVVRRGECSFASKLNAVREAGAVAMVVANNLESTPWSGMRIWDYSDPENPVLASIFDTTCSASTEPGGTCDPRGTYSSHNVIVEGTKAYISWYSEGVLVLDIADPYNPVEVARYHESGPEFEERNAGIQDVWGIYKIPGEPWVYASDRNGGLYILKEKGAGSGKVKGVRGKP